MICPVCQFPATSFGWAEHHRKKMPYSCRLWLLRTCPHEWERRDDGKVCTRCGTHKRNTRGLGEEKDLTMAELRDEAGRIPMRNRRVKRYPLGPTGKHKRKQKEAVTDGVENLSTTEAAGGETLAGGHGRQEFLEETRRTAEGDHQS